MLSLARVMGESIRRTVLVVFLSGLATTIATRLVNDAFDRLKKEKDPAPEGARKEEEA